MAQNQALARELNMTRDDLAGTVKRLREQLDESRAVSVRSALTEQRERRGIAEQYREQLAQLLVGIQYKAGVFACERGVQSDPLWRDLTDLIATALRTALTIGGTLAPHVLPQEELVPALRWLAAWMQERYGFTVELAAPAELTSMPEPLNILLFHAIRHLLINAATHAQVGTARVALSQEGEQLQVAVSDNGSGFDPSSTAQHRADGRVGLASIDQMMTYLGGRFDIESGPGKGSRITLTVPLHPTP